jgi:hypothetical protein
MVAKIQRPVITHRRYNYCQQWRPKFVANAQPLFASIKPPSDNFWPRETADRRSLVAIS